MSKDRSALMGDSYQIATEIIKNSAQCIADGVVTRRSYKNIKDEVLEDYPILVIGHALLTFLDARYKKQSPSDDVLETRDSAIEYHKIDNYGWWQRAWERANPNLTHEERSQGIKAIGWVLENYKQDRSLMEENND